MEAQDGHFQFSFTSASTDGLILEKGVFDIKRIDKGIELKSRDSGWHTFTNVLALDQPVGTGYSNGPGSSYARTLEEVANTFDEFLTLFFELFPEYAKDEVYLGGESFAGIWIPTFANYTLRRSQAMKVNIKGLFIDSGWIDPQNQYASILPMVEKYDLLPESTMSDFKGYFQECMDALKHHTIITATLEVCEDMVKRVSHHSIKKDKTGEKTCMNQYDFRLRDSYPECGMGWPPSISEFHEYMRREDVVKALNTRLNHGNWEECAPKVYEKLNMEEVGPTIDLLPDLLKQLPILLFTGEYDFMVNNIGMDYLVGNLTQRTRDETQHRLTVSDPDEGKWIDWGIDPQAKSGQLARWGNLVQASVYNASHMASYDQPIPVGSLMRWFINGRPSSGVIPEPKSAPGFFYVSQSNQSSTPIPISKPSLDKVVNNSSSISDKPTSEPVVESSSVMWAGVLVAFAVLGCLIIGLVRSRHRNPFRPDHQELLASDETEMDTTHHFNDALPDVPERNSGDDYAFEFHDSDEDSLVNREV